MRKLGALVLAVPVILAIYLRSLPRRTAASRIGAGVAAFAILGLVVVASLPPAPSTASPASRPAPVSASVLDAVTTGHPLTSPFSVQFGSPMDAASVAAALRIQPDASFQLRWDADATTVTIAPVDHWQPDSLYSITIDDTARSLTGAALSAPVRALFLTEQAGTGTIEATRAVGNEVALDTAFRLDLDRPVTIPSASAALRTDPVIAGSLSIGDNADQLVFTPAVPLQPATTYHVWLAGLVDAEGVAFETAPDIRVTTVGAPEVVRFRPRAGSRDVDPKAPISVRFTETMNRAATAAAFHVTVGGKPVAGKTRWAEKGTVLLFDPAADLPWSATVTMRVDATAVSRAGVPLASAASGTFTVKAKPAPKPAPRPAKKPASRTITHSGGSGAVAGTWKAVEQYYLKLMNCTRTGGWVTSTGSCSSPGGRNVAPLWISSAISDKVSRPYAKLLATRGLCDHFIGGTPGDRLRRAGFTSYRWAENLGCRSGNPYSAVLGSHLFFQSEKSYNGGHYVNLMNPAYDRVGIGVWVYAKRVRLVVDFYHP